VVRLRLPKKPGITLDFFDSLGGEAWLCRYFARGEVDRLFFVR